METAYYLARVQEGCRMSEIDSVREGAAGRGTRGVGSYGVMEAWMDARDCQQERKEEEYCEGKPDREGVGGFLRRRTSCNRARKEEAGGLFFKVAAAQV